jgi:hypothetical protein
MNFGRYNISVVWENVFSSQIDGDDNNHLNVKFGTAIFVNVVEHYMLSILLKSSVANMSKMRTFATISLFWTCPYKF